MLKSFSNTDSPLKLGILGGGQLAKMLSLSAYRLGLNVAIIENQENSPAGDMTKSDYSKGWLNDDELSRFISECDLITLENEFIDPNILEKIEKYKKVYPSSYTMRLVQDKYIQKQTFSSSNIPVPTFDALSSIDDAIEFGNKNGFPFIIKSRKFGYDGYGNATIKNKKDIESAWQKFKSDSLRSEIMAEKFVNFSKELAVMAVRSINGEMLVYPCVETIQQNHICHTVIAPAQIDSDLQKRAQEISMKAVEAINGVGVFGVELFLTEDDEILLNEIAPRPHNSGHYTIEACYCSQYENAIRAICGLPLGSTEMVKKAAVMVNLLGKRNGSGVPDNIINTLSFNNVWLHLYNKKSSRIGRKMGHITAIDDNWEIALKTAQDAANALIW